MLCALLAQPEVRLITITGPGGVGKTRIAVHVAQDTQAVEGFDSVEFVSLAALRDPGHVLPAIAQALGLDLGDRPPVEHLARVLAARRLLLILDNLEHLLTCAPQLTQLLSACPRLTILATSREALRVRGEHEVPIPPLPVPARSDPSLLADILESEAIALLVQRAQAVLPDFAVTVENVPAVVQICWRLDGLPLAIELAAARVKLLPPNDLLARLDHRLTLLTGGARDLPERHQTLRATLAWSYELLSASEQRLFRGLSIFPAGWTLDAAEAVLGAHRDVDVLDGIASLLDKSLLVRAEHADGSPRYRMLETVLEFAAEHLVARGEADDLHQRLTDWGLTLFDPNVSTWIFDAKHHAVFARVTPELDNLRAAVHWGVERYPPARQLAAHLGWHYSIRGLLRDAVILAERALAAAIDDPPQLRVNLLLLLGLVAFQQVKYELALQYAVRGEELATEATLPDSGGFLLLRWLLTSMSGAFAEAEALLERAIAPLGPPERAAAANRTQSLLAETLYRHGNVERAAALAAEALAVARARHDDWCAAMAQFTLARVAGDRGDVTGAVAAFVETARLGWSVGNVRQAAWCMWGMGVLLARYQQPIPAVTLLVVATTLQELRGDLTFDDGPATAGRALAELQAQLPAETFDAAARVGRGMTTEEAIAFAATLALPSPAPSPPVAAPAAYGLTPRVLEILRLLGNDSPLGAASTPPETRSAADFDLTPRELEVLQLLAAGLSDREIGEALFIAPRTASFHVTNLLRKLDVDSRTAAATFAVRHRLI
jgi:non-specific serine/threonine protein kinase